MTLGVTQLGKGSVTSMQVFPASIWESHRQAEAELPEATEQCPGVKVEIVKLGSLELTGHTRSGKSEVHKGALKES